MTYFWIRSCLLTVLVWGWSCNYERPLQQGLAIWIIGMFINAAIFDATKGK